jgi:hypothetical protein
MITDPEQKIARPRQIYTGARKRGYVPMKKRPAGDAGHDGTNHQHRATRLAPMPFASGKGAARSRF